MIIFHFLFYIGCLFIETIQVKNIFIEDFQILKLKRICVVLLS